MVKKNILDNKPAANKKSDLISTPKKAMDTSNPVSRNTPGLRSFRTGGNCPLLRQKSLGPVQIHPSLSSCSQKPLLAELGWGLPLSPPSPFWVLPIPTSGPTVVVSFSLSQQNEAKLEEILKELRSLKDTIAHQDERISKLEQQVAKMVV